jgi:hypothetical protein
LPFLFIAWLTGGTADEKGIVERTLLTCVRKMNFW